MKILASEPKQHGDNEDQHDSSRLQPHLSLSDTSSSDDVPEKGAAGMDHSTTNRCFDVDMSLFGKGVECGAPLSEPCFDFARCPDGYSGIYVYDASCSLANSSALLGSQEMEQDQWTLKFDHANIGGTLRNEANDAGLLAHTYESACLFVSATSSAPGLTSCAVEQPYWNGGSNHLMVDLSDKGR